MWWLVASAATAGPWTRDLGSVYAKLGADGYLAGAYQAPAVNDQATTRFLGWQYGAYLEAGLSPEHPVQIALQAPIVDSVVDFRAEDAFQRVTGSARTIRPGDLRITPQVALHRRIPLAAALEVKVPLYRVEGICDDPEQLAYQDVCPRPGDGQVDLTEWVLVGASEGKAFGELGAGYQQRTSWFIGWDPALDLADGVRWRATGGVWAFEWLLGMLKADAVHPLRADGVTPGMISVGPALLVDLAGGVAVEARLARDLWVANTAPGTSWGFGLSYRR